MKSPKVLYAIQGTGNGHVARALEIIPILKKYAQVDILLSGNQSEIKLPFDVRYQKRGLVMLYSKKGGVSFWKTIWNTNLFTLCKDVLQLPVRQYDLVISDFEFTSAWSSKLKGVTSVNMGHQASFVSKQIPLPSKQNWFGAFIIKYYAPAKSHIGYHFKAYDSFIHTPVIRKGIREMQIEDKGHYTVYLPAFNDETLIKKLSKLKKFHWQVFSKLCEKPYVVGNVHVQPVHNEDFLESFKTCAGVLTSAGFETPAEALFLGKKLFVIPIKHQYEQYCNAAALEELTIPVAKNLSKKTVKQLKSWCKHGQAVKIEYKDTTEADIVKMLEHNLSISLDNRSLLNTI